MITPKNIKFRAKRKSSDVTFTTDADSDEIPEPVDNSLRIPDFVERGDSTTRVQDKINRGWRLNSNYIALKHMAINKSL